MSTVPRWGACLIVRDESERIDACLTSAARAGCETVTLLDTGSRDSTVATAQACADREGFDLRIGHFDWCDDFGAARSAAFALARGTGDW